MVLNRCFPSDPMISFYAKSWNVFPTNGNKSLTRGPRLFDSIIQSVNYGLRSFISGYGAYNLTKIRIIALKKYVWKGKSDWGWCLGGAYLLAEFQAGGAYRGGVYKKKRVMKNCPPSNYTPLQLGTEE